MFGINQLNIFSRDFYEKATIAIFIPFYIFFLVGIYFHWIALPSNPFPKFILLSSLPLILLSLYLTSHKKIFPQRIGDCIHIFVWILILASANTYWGGPMKIYGPLFVTFIFLIPFFSLLLDQFLPYFITIIISILLVLEFFLEGSFSSQSIFQLSCIVPTIFAIAFTSSSLIEKMLVEEKTKKNLLLSFEELKKIDASKTEFLSIASHQLRTPLTAIRGYSSMLKEGDYGEIPEKAKKAVNYIHQATVRMIDLINDLLNISRIQIGKIQLKLEDAFLENIIQDAIKEVEFIAQEKHLYINFEKPSPKTPPVKVDKSKIKQVIINILDNAIRYTDKGGVTIKLKVENSKIKIIIIDTGQGIEKEEIEKLFETFSRGKAGLASHTQGSGFGLYIAKKFIEMHNGKIWVKSQGLGKGSTFYIELPMEYNK